MSGDVPSFTEFDPRNIKWQYQAHYDINNRFDYSLGVHEVLYSGTVGSAKSLLATFQLIDHITEFEKANALIGRTSLPDLKDTIVVTIDDHIEGDFEEGWDYEYNAQKASYLFRNGSRIISRSWHKKNFKRFGSLKLSFAYLEELAENEGDYWGAYEAIFQRLGRQPHVPRNLMVSCTNPDSPTHPAYERFFESDSPRRHVYLSDTRHNPFLPEWYIQNLLEDLSPIEVERKIKGLWVEDPKGGIYYNYDGERNFRNETYIFNLNHPIDIMHDFNIGHGKPMSAAVGQVINGVFHIAKTYLVEGADTNEIMQEMAEDGVFERKTNFRIFGDAAGRARDTRSKRSDYDIITAFLDRYRRKDQSKVSYTLKVPLSNPPIRKRHNKVNAKFCNGLGEVQLYIYKEARDAHKGFTTVKLKKGAGYLELETREQHVTTAIGYYIVKIISMMASSGKLVFTQSR